MVEIPEHLLKRSREAMARAKAKKGEVAPAEPAEAEAAEAPPAPAAEAIEEQQGPEAQGAGAEKVAAATAETQPAAARPAAEGGGALRSAGIQAPAKQTAAVASEARPGVAAPSGAVAVATKKATAKAAPQPQPKQHTHRLLTVVKAGSIQQTKPEAVDKVSVWPHLLAIEFLACLACLVFLVLFSIFVNAPLLAEANYNKTPNPSKAPWYFLGLQELLAYFDPMVAGVTIPGMGIFWLMVAPYIDRNPSTDPNHRKFAIALFTYFLMFWAVLVIIGSFFRGQGYNFVFPWSDGLFFEL